MKKDEAYFDLSNIQRSDENLELQSKTYHVLMPFKVREILIVSSLYDAFVIEEEGLVAPELGKRLRQMAKFRNRLVHLYGEVDNAYVFTYNYNFNLTGLATSDQTRSFRVPNLLDPSPMILLLNGRNASTSYAEWVSYPQLPLEMGADLHSASHSRVIPLTYMISVISAFYELTILYQNVEDYNV